MPKGQSPSSLLQARFDKLDAQLDRMSKDYSFFTKVRRKVKEFLGTDSGQLVTSEARTLIKRKLEKIEANWIRQGKMKDKVEEATKP